MKRRLAPILTIGIAVILIGSLAYAADRRKQAKQVGYAPDPAHEEEALRAELLDAVGDHGIKSLDAAEAGKVVGGRSDQNKDLSPSSKLTLVLPDAQ